MSNSAKKHHFVPECYLKIFITNSHLYTLDVSKVKKGVPHFVRHAQPGGICYIEHYYTIPQARNNAIFKLDGLSALFVESTVLTTLERKYAKDLYPKLCSGDSLSLDDANDLADFILQLKFRNPFHYNSMKGKMPEMIEDVMAKISENAFQPGARFSHIPRFIRESIVDKVKQEAIDNPLFSKQMQLSRFVEEYKDPKKRQMLRNAILGASWFLLKSPSDGPFFITSDNPGFATAPDGLNYNTKFVDGFAFYFPVSPVYCLLITDLIGPARNFGNIIHQEIDASSVIGINDRAIQQVNRLLIASDNWYLNQILTINKKV
jgi:hypothetical protein